MSAYFKWVKALGWVCFWMSVVMLPMVLINYGCVTTPAAASAAGVSTVLVALDGVHCTQRRSEAICGGL